MASYFRLIARKSKPRTLLILHHRSLCRRRQTSDNSLNIYVSSPVCAFRCSWKGCWYPLKVDHLNRHQGCLTRSFCSEKLQNDKLFQIVWLWQGTTFCTTYLYVYQNTHFCHMIKLSL